MSHPNRYKLVGHEFEDEGIYCKIKIYKLNKIITRSATDVYYDDDWLSGFNIKDIRAISTLVAQEDLSKCKKQINTSINYLPLILLKKWLSSLFTFPK